MDPKEILSELILTGENCHSLNSIEFSEVPKLDAEHGF